MPSIIFKGPARYLKRKRRVRKQIGTAYAHRREVLKRIGFESYAEYLAHPFWKLIRDAKLAVDPDCELCGQHATEVHHLSYRLRTLTGKDRHKLVSICHKCHTKLEIRRDGTKRNFESVMKKTRTALRMVGKWLVHTRKGKARQ